MEKIDGGLIDLAVEPDGDKVHRVARAVVGSVPVLGASMLEAFNAIIEPPMERRKAAWMKQVTEAINELYERGVVTEEGLSKNEKFFTTLVHASNIALRNHQQEKIEALKNATLNSAVSETIDDSVQQLFLNMIDTCTVWHIKLLQLFAGPEEWARRNSHTFPQWHLSSSITAVIESAYPEVVGKKSFYEMIWKDLHRSGMLNTDSIAGMMTPGGALAKRTTPFGDEFIAFVTKPNL